MDFVISGQIRLVLFNVKFRKITNGFRSNWRRDLFAMIHSIVNTGRRQGLSAFESILAALNPIYFLFVLSLAITYSLPASLSLTQIHFKERTSWKNL